MHPDPSRHSIRDIVRRCAVLIGVAALTGCGGGGSDGGSAAPAAIAPPRPFTQTDLEIAQDLYRGTSRTPGGFYTETSPSGHAYVSTSHLKNADLGASSSQPLYELCTNDWNEALSWSETSAQQASQYAALVETNDDGRYFEFGRTRSGDPNFYQRTRVFKCAYLDRSGANLRIASGPAGQLNQRPLSAADLKTLSEYLWQFTGYNNFGHIVLRTSGEPTGAGLSHTLHMASLVRGGMSASCDRIDVLAWRHEVNATTGALLLNVQTLWSFGARESAGVAELCGA